MRCRPRFSAPPRPPAVPPAGPTPIPPPPPPRRIPDVRRADPVSELGYEQARDELIEVVRILEAGGQDLDASLALWERGEELAARCTEHLDGARKRIDAVLGDDDEAGSSPS
ncbi:exodeoxyribonuclease VII small subunit [Dietzia aerolata]|uniref:exodeoxyribonuclease VII small subunit n=1 Tax=Dietzia aerolata TaxID=595984 RepID=UPI003633C5A8